MHQTDKDAVSVAGFKDRCFQSVTGERLLKTLVILGCTVVVIQQVSASIQKLINIPITTYTHFDFNKTLLYPSITFCREPPYKYDKMLEYGLYSHPRYTSVWRNFNFSSHSLDDLWEDITYNDDDYFVQFGLEGLMENVDVKATVGFVLGRCYTLNPRIVTSRATKATGYSVTLQHTARDVATSSSIYPPGYHIYVHYVREPFTEVEVYNGGMVDYVYASTGETIDVKLTVDEYIKISSTEDPCVYQNDYSANKCTTKYVSKMMDDIAGCSGPWLLSDLPHCADHRSMTALITAYVNTYQNHNCSVCPRFCRAYLYNAYVTGRQVDVNWDSATRLWHAKTGEAALQTQIYLHFNAMMVSVYEERYNYDWNLFISDLGGSIGFLLGLSVIGLTTIIAQAWLSVVRPLIKKPKDDASISGSTVTADIAVACKDKEFLRKYNEWSKRNSAGLSPTI